MTTVQDVLQKLRAPSAAAVALSTIPNVRGAHAGGAAAGAARRAEAISRGECVAGCNGSSVGISATLANALVAAGAKDER